MGDVLEAIQGISLIIAAWTAILGINAWRNEFIGKKRIELAEDVLVHFYEARDVIRLIRSPFSQIGEGSSRQARDNETPEEKEVLNNAFIVFERYEKHRELFNQIESLKYRFRAQFGADAAQPFEDLRVTLNDIFISAQMLRHYWRDQGRRQWRTDEQFRQHLAEMQRHEAVFWEMSKDDDISTRVNKAVSGIENICSRIINPPKRSLPFFK